MKCGDFRSENGLMMSVLVAELFSKSRFKAVVVAYPSHGGMERYFFFYSYCWQA